MFMTDEERMNHRKMADKLVKLADVYGYADDMRVSVDGPEWLTVGHLRRHIEPDYEHLIARAIAIMEKNYDV